MVARLVAVGVLTDEAGDVRRSVLTVYSGISGEKRVKPLDKLLAGAVEINQAGIVVRSEPGILPGVSLTIIISAMLRGIWIERSPPAAVCHLSSCEQSLRIHIIAVGMAAVTEIFSVIRLAKVISGGGHSCIRNGIFHIKGY